MNNAKKIENIRKRLFELSQGATAVVFGRIVTRIGDGFEIGTVDGRGENLSSYRAAVEIAKG